MKIFGKRKKSAKVDEAQKSGGKSTGDIPQQEETRVFASDTAVQELLKKDPSGWNAKEKRMVKRYQKRKTEEGDKSTDDAKEDKKSKEPKSQKKAVEAEQKVHKDEADSSDNEDDSSSSRGDNSDSSEDENKKDDNTPEDQNNNDDEVKEVEGEQDQGMAEASRHGGDNNETMGLDLESVLDSTLIEGLNSKQRRTLSRTLAKNGASAVKQVIDEANQIVHGNPAAKQEDTTSDSAENKANDKKTEDEDDDDEMSTVQNLLQSLNSKQKRKLSRRLEREGSSCLAEVKAEAEALLKGDPKSPADDDNNNASTGTSQTVSGKKRKRRRGTADLSGLTPEERLRREEQRKMQKEAAERRANGEEDASFKHPLNSERRRANRRKPKWAPKKAFTQNQDKIEHNASGFHVRKIKKAQE
ncbi:expressed unknown protein [Seminavis robusta]|uniref:Uncharacterized protein n=1 Tax=Seminavis robusta TaxID=568900 RepID=A0A9N8DDX3_9STRA|nr:expressed unknown protein [Seminavis robusta]|eukprot:Sro49_g028780.1 n/a (414) ;mRNA; r:118802-120043